MLSTWGCATFPKPTLDLQFEGATSLDSRIDFTRGSQATLFDSAGTLVYAKHNLLLQSQTFQTTWTTSQASVSTDATTAPDGTLSADKIVENLTTNYRYVNQTITVTAGTHTASVYAKSAGRTWLLIAFGSNPTNGGAWFNLSSGVVGTTQANVISAAIVDVGNGWYRCSVTVAMTAGSATYRISPTSADNVSSYEGDGTSGIFIWGAQFNLSNMEGGVTSSLTTYYPTTTAAYYGPRFDYDPSTLAARGLLIEEARTNSIRNNTMQGAVAGTPGTYPTNWAINAGGLSVNVIGTGIENGITYIDLQFTGTPTAVSANARFEPNTQIVAANGQTWTGSFYARQVGGTTNNILDVNQTVFFRDAAGVILTQQNTTLTNLSATSIARNRQTSTFTAANASTAFVNNSVQLSMTIGVGPVDITLRVGLPQLELGAFATSVIPTTTTALTRNADVASMTGTNFSSWFNAVEGTLVCIGTSNASSSDGTSLAISDGTNGNRIQFGTGASNTVWNPFVVTSASTVATLTQSASFSPKTNPKLALAYKANDFAATTAGASVVTDASGNVPVVDRLLIGASGSGTVTWNSYIQRISYYPSRLPNTTLQALTA